MKKIAFLLLQVIFMSFAVYPQSIEIKSLRVYPENDQSAFPVITPNGDMAKRITIEFDVQSVSIPNFNIVFRYCDMNWNPYQNIFLQNQGKNISYNLGFEYLPRTVKSAHFHYKGSYPDSKDYVEFPFSGKWMFYITDSQDTSIIYGKGKFYVVYQDVALRDTLKNERLEDKVYFPTDLSKVFNLTTDFNLPNEFYPSSVNCVEIVENHKIDYPEVIGRGFNTNTRQFYWNGSREFSFIARDLRPGNEYRQVDLRDINKFNSENVNAQFDGLEYSRFFKEGNPDLNGGSLLTNYKDNFATYLNVTFSIRPPSQVYGGVYLVGAFNNWKLSPDYMMKENYGVYSLTIPLKRGVYDYQYVVADNDNGVIDNADWYVLEGNDYSTTDVYHVFLYYNDPNYGGYDRIIGYQRIESK